MKWPEHKGFDSSQEVTSLVVSCLYVHPKTQHEWMIKKTRVFFTSRNPDCIINSLKHIHAIKIPIKTLVPPQQSLCRFLCILHFYSKLGMEKCGWMLEVWEVHWPVCVWLRPALRDSEVCLWAFTAKNDFLTLCFCLDFTLEIINQHAFHLD